MCDDYEDPSSSLTMVLGEDGQLTEYVPEPCLIFQMDMEKAIAFITALHQDKNYKDFFDDVPFTMENVDVEEFIRRVKELNGDDE